MVMDFKLLLKVEKSVRIFFGLIQLLIHRSNGINNLFSSPHLLTSATES